MLQRRGPDDYQLLTRLEYDDPTFAPLKAPRDMNELRTGLASVPTFAAWLAPTTRRHLPATLLHDVLILRPDEPQQHIASLLPLDEIPRLCSPKFPTPRVARRTIGEDCLQTPTRRRRRHPLHRPDRARLRVWAVVAPQVVRLPFPL